MQPYREIERTPRRAERPLRAGDRVRVLEHAKPDAGREALVWLVTGGGIARRLVVRFVDDRRFGIFDDSDLARVTCS